MDTSHSLLIPPHLIFFSNIDIILSILNSNLNGFTLLNTICSELVKSIADKAIILLMEKREEVENRRYF